MANAIAVRGVSLALAMLGGSGLAPGVLGAQDLCDPEVTLEPLDIKPAVGGTRVTLTAPIFVRYPSGYFSDDLIAADPTTSIRVAEEREREDVPVPGTVQVIGDTLIFRADQPFAPNTRYVGTAFGFDADLDFNFVTGEVAVDADPPSAPVLNTPSATRVDACDGGEAFRIDVSFSPSVDPGAPAGDIEYLLYLIRGPTVGRPELVARTRNIATEQITMAFLLDRDDVVGPLCVTVHAVDGVGNVNDQAEFECFDPISGNFFEPLCRVAPAGASGAGAGQAGAGLLVAVLFGVVVTRVRRSPRPERCFERPSQRVLRNPS